MMKKFSLFMLVVILAAPMLGHAKSEDGDDPNLVRWENFCKHNERKCADANRMCEMGEQYTCAEVREAFMAKRALSSKASQKNQARK